MFGLYETNPQREDSFFLCGLLQFYGRAISDTEKKYCLCVHRFPWPSWSLLTTTRLWQDTQQLAGVARSVMFQQRSGSSRPQACVVSFLVIIICNCGLVLNLMFIRVSGMIAITSNSAIISRSWFTSNQCKRNQNLALQDFFFYFHDFTCLILHQLSFSALCFFQVASTSRVCLRHYSSNQASNGATGGRWFFFSSFSWHGKKADAHEHLQIDGCCRSLLCC